MGNRRNAKATVAITKEKTVKISLLYIFFFKLTQKCIYQIKIFVKGI